MYTRDLEFFLPGEESFRGGVNMPQFVSHPPVAGHLGCFLVLCLENQLPSGTTAAWRLPSAVAWAAFICQIKASVL